MMISKRNSQNKLALIAAFAVVFTITGCGGSSGVKGNSGTPVTELNPDGSTPRRASPTPKAVRGRKTAVAHLMNSASHQARKGNFSTAAELLERGLSINPYNAQLWGSLAGIRFKQKNYSLSESLAHKSNSFAESNRVLKLKNWRLIAESRTLRGNTSGAEMAAQKVRDLLQ